MILVVGVRYIVIVADLKKLHSSAAAGVGTCCLL